MCTSSGGQNCIIQHLVSSHSVGGRPVHRLWEDFLSQPVHRTATYRLLLVFGWPCVLLVGRVYCCSCLLYIVVVVLCVLLSSYVYLLYCVCITAFTLDAGLLARSQYSESPATGHLDTGFSWFPCVYKQMLRWFPKFQVATTCFSCSPPT